MQSDLNTFFWGRVGEIRHHQRGDMTFAYQHNQSLAHPQRAGSLGTGREGRSVYKLGRAEYFLVLNC